MEPERPSTQSDTRVSRARRTCQFITAVVCLSLDTEAVVYLGLCIPPLLFCRTHLVRAR